MAGNNYLFKYILIVVSLIFITCNSQLQKTDINKYTFDVKESLSLPLDTLTGFNSSSIQNVLIGDEEFLFQLYITGSNPSISVFDLREKKLDRKIYLSQEGPNGVPNPFGLFVLNYDSIFVHARPLHLYLINRFGSVINRINISDGTLEIEPTVMLNTIKPAIYRDNKIYLCAELIYAKPIIDHSKIPVVIKLDINTKEISYPFYRTDKYQEGQWGMTSTHARFYQTYNPDKDLMVHSHGNDGYVYVYDELNNMSKYYAGSSSMKEIKPYSKSKVLEPSESFRYEATTGAYNSIMYDRYRKMYYRFTFLPVEDIATQPSVFYGRIAIIILDDNFQKVGEYVLPKGYEHTMSFVGKAGLHIASRSKYSQDEDHLTFDIFVPVEN
jgi:hypothetical protein